MQTKLILCTCIFMFSNLFSQDYWQRTKGGGKRLANYKNYIVSLDPEIKLYSENGKYLKNLKEEHSLEFTLLFDFDSDDNYLWLATDSGLFKMDEFGYQKYTLDEKIAYGVAVTDDNTVYAGGRDGLYILKDGFFQLVNNSMKVYQMEYTDALYAFNNPSSNISTSGSHSLNRLGEFNEWIQIESEELGLTNRVFNITLKKNLDNKLVIHLGNQGGLIYDKTQGTLTYGKVENLEMDIYYADKHNLWIKKESDKYLLKINNSDTSYFSETDEIPKNCGYYGNTEVLTDLIIPNNKIYILSNEHLYVANSSINEINGKKNSIHLDANKLKVGFETGYNLFNQKDSALPAFEIKHRNAHLAFAANLWLLGRNENKDLHYFATHYGESCDFLNLGTLKNKPGVIRKVSVKVNKVEIEYHQANYNKPGYTMPSGIKHWPANLYPQFGEKGEMAPYEDFNKNGIYDPENGDYPIIIGQEMVYMIFNDGLEPHLHSSAKALGSEVHIAAYAFVEPVDKRDQNIYLNVFVKNQSNYNYPTFQAALFLDFDIGSPRDDFIGSDSINSIAYAYNGDSFDDSNLPYEKGFGENPPFIGIKPILNNFSYIRDYSTFQNIQNISYVKNAFEGKNQDGSPYEELGKHTKFCYNGNPATANGNTEVKLGNNPSDRRILVIWPEAILNAGQYKAYNMVMGYNDDAPSGHHLSSFTNLVPQLNNGAKYIEEELDIPKEWEPRIRGKYTSIKNQKTTENIIGQISPNPAKDYFEYSGTEDPKRLELYDLGGRLIKSWKNGEFIYSVKGINSGQYILKVTYAAKTESHKLIINN